MSALFIALVTLISEANGNGDPQLIACCLFPDCVFDLGNLHGCSFKFEMNFSSLRRSINSAPYLACVPLSTSRKYAWRLFSTANFDLKVNEKSVANTDKKSRAGQGRASFGNTNKWQAVNI